MTSAALAPEPTRTGTAMPAGQRRALGVILAVSMAIAVVAPFDVYFTAATFGSPLLRAVLIVVLALIGGRCALDCGLSLTGNGGRSSLLIGLFMAAAMAGYVLALDCWLFRDTIDPGYAAFLHLPLPYRLSYFMLRAFNENVMYRLFAFSALTWLASRACGVKIVPVGLLVAIMIAAQMLNIGMNVVAAAHEPLTAAVLGYDALRYIVPGVTWAWLFWRFGFVTAEIASVCCHLFLQPGFSYLL